MVSPRLSLSVSSTELSAVRPVSASAAAFDVRQAVRLLGDDRGLDRDLLGVGALLARRQHAEHRVADLEVGDALAERADGAGEIPPQHVRKLQRAVVAAAHLPVGAVDGRSHDVDHDIARPRPSGPADRRI